MADTRRSLTDLLALLADNTSRAISPQDLRDALVSAHGTYGMMYTKDGSTAQGSIGTSFAQLTGFAVDGLSGGTTPANATDDITVGTDGVYAVMLQASFTGTAATEFTLNLHVNDAEGVFQCSQMLDAAGAVVSGSVFGLLSLSATDDVSVYVKADGASKSITIEDLQMFVLRIA